LRNFTYPATPGTSTVAGPRLLTRTALPVFMLQITVVPSAKKRRAPLSIRMAP
jgi:hypothetical protein